MKGNKEGEVVDVDLVKDIVIVLIDGKRTYSSLRDVPLHKKENIHVGDYIVLIYPADNRYFAKDIELKGIKVTDKTEKSEKKGKTIADLVSVAEPIINQELLDKLSPSERQEIKELLIKTTEMSLQMYHTTSTYEDTKKDTTEIITSIMDNATVFAVLIDANSTQLLKSKL